MFGKKKKNLEVAMMLESAAEDRRVYSEEAQKNRELMLSAITELNKNRTAETSVAASEQSKDPIISPEEKLQAAYALNLCTVSISQIIDYNDLIIMEQEYNTILNNLNLENMPKDEALLKILKQIIDVIAFFRIQAEEKKIIEFEYNQRVKNAIWSAIPNPSIILTSGNWVSMCVALATQVGISYMNYRRTRGDIDIEKRRKEWELHKSALEQFDALRRELFDTAWRLADEYDFPDELRLTAQQITQFNFILQDRNPVRRFERLDFIKDKFKAYPSFWYYYGHAANEASALDSLSVEKKTFYVENAKGAFNWFLKITNKNLLREDKLLAACSLELFEIVVADNSVSQGEKSELLLKAETAAGNSHDILQICAISYLRIGNKDRALRLLNMLINEGYNEELNLQLVSMEYVSAYCNGEKRYKECYEDLRKKAKNATNLFPLPADNVTQDFSHLSSLFVNNQLRYAYGMYTTSLEEYAALCEAQFVDIWNRQYDVTLEVVAMFQGMKDNVDRWFGHSASQGFFEKISESVAIKCPALNTKLQCASRSKDETDIFENITIDAFAYIVNIIREENTTLKALDNDSKMEMLSAFINRVAIMQNTISTKQKHQAELLSENPVSAFEAVFCGSNYDDYRQRQEMIDLIENEFKSGKIIIGNHKKFELLVKKANGNYAFSKFIDKNWVSLQGIDTNSIIAILNDKSFHDQDLLFTTTGMIVLGWILDSGECEYKAISSYYPNILIGDVKYHNKNIDCNGLYSLIEKLRKMTAENEEAQKGNFANKVKAMFALELVVK